MLLRRIIFLLLIVCDTGSSLTTTKNNDDKRLGLHKIINQSRVRQRRKGSRTLKENQNLRERRAKEEFVENEEEEPCKKYSTNSADGDIIIVTCPPSASDVLSTYGRNKSGSSNLSHSNDENLPCAKWCKKNSVPWKAERGYNQKCDWEGHCAGCSECFSDVIIEEDPPFNIPTTSSPTLVLTGEPTPFPTAKPSPYLTSSHPTPSPSSHPTPYPTDAPITSSPTSIEVSSVSDFSVTLPPSSLRHLRSATHSPTTELPTASPTTEPTTSFPTTQPTTDEPSTTHPTNSPTKHPTNEPTNEPTKPPTLNPTKNPTQSPMTLSPTNHPTTTHPTTTHQPTHICNDMGREERASQITDIIESITPPNTSSSSSPQSQALDWIINDDVNVLLCPYDDRLVQRYALTVLYFSMVGDEWMECGRVSDDCDGGMRFLSDRHECDWNGIICNDDGYVREIHLDEKGMTGTIPSELSSLTHLEALDLDDNEIFGTMPPSFGRLRKLRILDVDKNVMTGSLPDEFYNLVNLEVLDLNNNRFDGILSEKIGFFEQLEFFQLHNNFFKGTIPKTLGNLDKLEILTVNGNMFEDHVPDEICALRNSTLQQLWADCGSRQTIECSCCSRCY